MSVRFRNVEVDPRSPLADWPSEAILTLLERGSLEDWRRLRTEIDCDPWGPVARMVEQALTISQPYGIAPLMEDAIAHARERMKARERRKVVAQVRDCLERSGLSQSEFAERIGTSASRLSTYLNGRVVPSAALLIRMQRVAGGVGGSAT